MPLKYRRFCECGGRFIWHKPNFEHFDPKASMWVCSRCEKMVSVAIGGEVSDPLNALPERNRTEVKLSLDYDMNYHHGTPGHLSMMTLAMVYKLLLEAKPNVD